MNVYSTEKKIEKTTLGSIILGVKEKVTGRITGKQTIKKKEEIQVPEIFREGMRRSYTSGDEIPQSSQKR